MISDEDYHDWGVCEARQYSQVGPDKPKQPLKLMSDVTQMLSEFEGGESQLALLTAELDWANVRNRSIH